MTRVTFADGYEDREDDSPCIANVFEPVLRHPSEDRWYLWFPDASPPFSFCARNVIRLSDWRGGGALVWRITSAPNEPLAGQWAECHVEGHEEQIARLTAERDAATRHLAAAVEQASALRDIEYRRAEAEKARADAATAWGSREAEALRLTTRALSLACSPIEDDVAREVLIRAICAAKEALVKAQPGMALNVGDVCSRLARTDAAEKRLADLRAWADDIAEGQRDSPEGRRVAGDFRAVVYRIDGEDGESK